MLLYGGALRAPVLRSHLLARYFADHVPVVYVPYRSLTEIWTQDYRFPPWQPLATHPNVRMLSMPLTTFLSRRSALLARFHAALAAHKVQGALRSLGVPPENAVFFLENATAVGVTDHFPRSPVLYDCADDLCNWHGASPRMRQLYREVEQDVTRRAAWIVVSIPRLLSRFEGAPGEVSLGLNGVEFELFSRPQPVPQDLARISQPWLVYMGAISRFVDREWVAALARSGIGSIVLVGPAVPNSPLAGLQDLPNVYWLGRRRYEELPGYIQAAAVTLIPGTTATASDCTPSKLFMYCAAGVPVVARECSSLSPFAGCIHLASDSDEFVKGVAEGLRHPDWGREDRIRLAREHGWERLSRDLLRRMGLLAAPEPVAAASRAGS